MKLKIPKTTYFVPLDIFAGLGVWGSGATTDEAIKSACREVREIAKAFGGIKKDARLDLNVYAIREGCYALKDERGTFEVDRETDRIVAYAEIVYRYGDVDPQRPLTSMKMRSVADAYVGGEKGIAQIRKLNADGAAPIGEIA